MSDVHVSDARADVARLVQCHDPAAHVRSAGGRSRAGLDARGFVSRHSLPGERREKVSRRALRPLCRNANAIARAAGAVPVDSRCNLDSGKNLRLGRSQSLHPQPRLWVQGSLRTSATAREAQREGYTGSKQGFQIAVPLRLSGWLPLTLPLPRIVECPTAALTLALSPHRMRREGG